MESLLSFDDYRAFLQQRIAEQPKHGYGVSGQLARAIGVHPSLVSQILNGTKQLNQDQALATAEFFGLSELETDYFLLLVQHDRAVTPRLRSRVEKKIAQLKEQSQRLVNRIETSAVLSEEARGIFYSSWEYTAVRQLTAIEQLDSVESIARALGLPRKDVRSIVDFLVEHRLCVVRDGRLAIGPQSTHLADSSPWVRVHHRNWRDFGIRRLERNDERDLFFTCPLTIGKADVARVRELAIQFIDQLYKIVDPSPSEQLSCLNLDWFAAGG